MRRLEAVRRSACGVCLCAWRCAKVHQVCGQNATATLDPAFGVRRRVSLGAARTDGTWKGRASLACDTERSEKKRKADGTAATACCACDCCHHSSRLSSASSPLLHARSATWPARGVTEGTQCALSTPWACLRRRMLAGSPMLRTERVSSRGRAPGVCRDASSERAVGQLALTFYRGRPAGAARRTWCRRWSPCCRPRT